MATSETTFSDYAYQDNISDTPSPYGSDVYIGLGLSSLSALFIGSSFIIKKKSLIALSTSGNIRAGSGGYGYLCSWMWWAGFMSMGLGEVFNFVAYAFAPATLVTPLGALSVLVTSLLSAYFLGEALNIVGKISCALCVIGSTVIVIHAPKAAEVTNLQDLQEKLAQPVFLIYVIVVITMALILMFHYSPTYGSRSVVVYIAICSLIGGFSVLACKAFGMAIKETIEGENQFTNWLTWFSMASLIVCVCTQMNYLNKALDIFNTSVVTPIYYVFFTTCVILASAVLFREWEEMAALDVIGVLSGFLTVILAIFQLNAFRDVDIVWCGMAGILGASLGTVDNPNFCESRQALLRMSPEEDESLINSSTHSYGSGKRVT